MIPLGTSILVVARSCVVQFPDCMLTLGLHLYGTFSHRFRVSISYFQILTCSHRSTIHRFCLNDENLSQRRCFELVSSVCRCMSHADHPCWWSWSCLSLPILFIAGSFRLISDPNLLWLVIHCNYSLLMLNPKPLNFGVLSWQAGGTGDVARVNHCCSCLGGACEWHYRACYCSSWQQYNSWCLLTPACP